MLFHQTAAHAVGLGPTDYQALNLLELRGPQSPGELSATLGLTTGATTRLVDRLVAAGCAERAADLGDRRRVVVRAVAVPPGLMELLAGVRGGIAEYVGALDPAELVVLEGYWRAAARSYAEAVTEVAGRLTD